MLARNPARNATRNLSRNAVPSSAASQEHVFENARWDVVYLASDISGTSWPAARGASATYDLTTATAPTLGQSTSGFLSRGLPPALVNNGALFGAGGFSSPVLTWDWADEVFSARFLVDLTSATSGDRLARFIETGTARLDFRIISASTLRVEVVWDGVTYVSDLSPAGMDLTTPSLIDVTYDGSLALPETRMYWNGQAAFVGAASGAQTPGAVDHMGLFSLESQTNPAVGVGLGAAFAWGTLLSESEHNADAALLGL